MSNLQYAFLSQLQGQTFIDTFNKEKANSLYSVFQREFGIVGTICGNQIEVYYRPQGKFAYGPRFCGIISAHPGGMLITGGFQKDMPYKYFVWAMIVGTLLIATPFFLSATNSYQKFAIIFGAVMFLTAFGLFSPDKTTNEKNKAEIIKFFEVKLLASLI